MMMYVLRTGWESSGVPGLVQRAALDFLWGGGWQDFVLEQGPGGDATAGNATAGGAPGLSLKGVAFPQNRALNARFAGARAACYPAWNLTVTPGCTPLQGDALWQCASVYKRCSPAPVSTMFSHLTSALCGSSAVR